MENWLWCQNSNILTYWKPWKTYCDVKYDVRYHKTAQKFTQLLECLQMIELTWKFLWIHIFIRGIRWWWQSSNILTYWRLRRIVTSNMTSDFVIAEKFIQMMLEYQQMIGLSGKFLYLYIFSPKDHNGHIRIMIFWIFGSTKTLLCHQIWRQIS